MDFAPKLHAAFNRISQGDQRAVVRELHATVSRKLAAYGLDTEEGRNQLSYEIACHITESPFTLHLGVTIRDYFDYEQLFELPTVYWDDPPTYAHLWMLHDKLTVQRTILDDLEKHATLIADIFFSILRPIFASCPHLLSSVEETSLSTPLLTSIPDFPGVLEHIIRVPFAGDLDDTGLCPKLREQLERNLILASGGHPTQPRTNTAYRFPPRAATAVPQELVDAYLDGTPLQYLLSYEIPFAIPTETRFEHHWIVGGSGHGKTQTLQYLIAHDIERVLQGEASVVVIDSQGDLINNIKQLSCFAPAVRTVGGISVGDLVQVTIGDFDHFKDGVRVREVHDGFVFVEGSRSGVPIADVRLVAPAFDSRLVLIDPNDIKWPVALNLFDVGMERINAYEPLDRERLINGIIELYDFVLGSLLSAELTQKQSVIFRYITRLMLHIPDATIHTLRELMEPEGYTRYEEHIKKLKGTARAFFQTEFRDSKQFGETKRQVTRRLWGILENQTFERMFSHPRNKLDLFSEMNKGKVILINTAKDLLKQNGCEIFGRFFIAMIAQAAQERATLPDSKRMPTFVYIDECQDYLDTNVSLILEQARKYKIGMVLAHQYLGQLEPRLRASFEANTAIKCAGGVSAQDARAFAAMMRTKPDMIEQQKKGSFATYMRGVTDSAVPVTFPFGYMEDKERMPDGQFRVLRDQMRRKYAVPYAEVEERIDQGLSEPAPEGDPDNPDIGPSGQW